MKDHSDGGREEGSGYGARFRSMNNTRVRTYWRSSEGSGEGARLKNMMVEEEIMDQDREHCSG